MNNSLLFPNIWRFIGLVAAQVLLFRQMSLTLGPNFHIFVYPLFILFLPIQINTVSAVLLGALVGLTVDMFYGTPGLHASAGAFAGFARSVILLGFQPRGGYSTKEVIAAPALFGWEWFLKVASLFFFLHLFWYFAVDAFTLVFLKSITIKTLIAWVLSMMFAAFYGFLLNPKQ